MTMLAGYDVPRLGLGTLALAVEGRPSRETAIDVIHAALDAGTRYLDTAWSYYLPTVAGTGTPGDLGYGETLVRDALATWDGPRDQVLVATKTGWRRTWDPTTGRYGWKADARPETMAADARQSAQRLGVDTLDLLYSHCDDPQLPYVEQMEVLRDLVDAGVARYAGVSRVGAEDIDIARRILGDRLVAVQNMYSPASRDPEGTFAHVRSLGLAFVCFSPLGGFLDPVDERAFAGFEEVARRRGCSRQRVVLAWELARDPGLFVIPSARSVAEAREDREAVGLRLTEDELATLPPYSADSAV